MSEQDINFNDKEKTAGAGIYKELDKDPGFQETQQVPTIIKVVGVGGGGNNAINHMYQQDIEGVSFVVLNTDKQALEDSPVPNRLLIGPNTTHGLGAGNVPEVARKAAEESNNDIGDLFNDGTRMVFITAGMGGGTGTGAAPVVARIAQEKDVLTIGIVTIPFLFEGQKKIMKALQGADEMGKYVDALLIINNQRLTEIYPDLDFNNAFGKADDTLTVAARSISELITIKGHINLDFNDVYTTLVKSGVAIISTGYGEGERRVTKAIEDALESPLLKNRDVYGSKRILFNVYYNPKAENPFKMDEINEIQEFMANFTNDVDVIWGATEDTSLDNKIKVTVLAAGFNLSLENEASGAGAGRRPIATLEKGNATGSRMEQEYGTEALDRLGAVQARARYFIFEPDEMDKDDLIDRVENTPTYKRKTDFNKTVRDQLQSNATPATPHIDQPKATKKTNTPTIDFGGA